MVRDGGVTQSEHAKTANRDDLEPFAGKGLKWVAVGVQMRLAALVGAAARDAERDAAQQHEDSKDGPWRHGSYIAHPIGSAKSDDPVGHVA